MGDKYMIDCIHSSLRSRPNGMLLTIGAVTVTLALITAPASGVDSALEVLENQSFNVAFRDYYEALDAHTVHDLNFELSETIEDVLTSGSHLGQVSLDYKVRQVETALFERLRQQFCPPSSPETGDLPELKMIAVRSVGGAGGVVGVEFTHEDIGMISGVVVRLLQKASLEELCRGN